MRRVCVFCGSSFGADPVFRRQLGSSVRYWLRADSASSMAEEMSA
jgi:hypothetical protein